MRRIILAACVIAAAIIPTQALRAATPLSIDDSIAWLATQQQADGGFGVAGFPGFETPDAILAIASAAQSGDSWSKTDASTAVENFENSTGSTPIDWLDDWVEGTLNAGQAANIVVLVTEPLGLNSNDVDPSNDSATPVDLIAIIDAAEIAGSYGAFNATLRAAQALYLTNGAVPIDTVDVVLAAQQPDGAWNFAGDPNGTDPGADTTGSALEVLSIAATTETDPSRQTAIAESINKGLSWLANAQQQSGAWQSFGSDDPNTTALVLRGLVAVGVDPANSCWRDESVPARASEPYGIPDAYLRSQQHADGHVISPFDSFGVNTLATSQTLAALVGSWVPVTELDRDCGGTTPQSASEGYALFKVGEGVGSLYVFRDTANGFTGNITYPSVVALDRNSASDSVWLAGSDGGIFTHGEAGFFGSATGIISAAVVDIAVLPNGSGYYLLTRDGGVFSFGAAQFHGSAFGLVTGNAVAIEAQAGGYVVLASDGGVFTFGDVEFEGSAVGLPLNGPVVDIALDPDGGYWIAANDGGVFSFGTEFLGSAVGIPEETTGIIAANDDGYWLIGQNGGVFSYDAPFLGSSFSSTIVRAVG